MPPMDFKEIWHVVSRDRFECDIRVNRHIHLLTSGGEDEGMLALRKCRDEISDLFAVQSGAYRFPISPNDRYP